MSAPKHFTLGLLFSLLLPSATLADEPVNVVGSSTLYPLAKSVAERASAAPQGSDYHIQATGTVAGIDLFCAGSKTGLPDILNASRRIRTQEMERCHRNGVTEVVEVKVGYDGISLAISSAGPDFAVTTRDIYLALAAKVPDPTGNPRLVANPYSNWSEINPQLPDAPIMVLGPPKTSGTRDAFAELAMEAGCGQFKLIREIFSRNRDGFSNACDTLRRDGAYREAGEDDDEIVTELLKDPRLIGIFGFHFLEANKPRLKAVSVDAVEPSLRSIAAGNYVLSRPLFVYFKKDNAGRMPGIQRYVQEFTSEEAWSEKGYLKEDGLIPMLLEERQKYAYIAQNLVDPSCPPYCR